MNDPKSPPSARLPLSALERNDAFLARHIGTGPEDQAAMLAALGFATRAALIDAVVPAAIRRSRWSVSSSTSPSRSRSGGTSISRTCKR